MRSMKDVEKFVVYPSGLKGGWVVEIQFKSGVKATFSIDKGNYTDEQMLEKVILAVGRQVAEGNG